MRDLKSNLKVVKVIDPAAAITDNTAQVGAKIDHQGFDSALYYWHQGEVADADMTLTPLLEESDDNVNFDAVDDADLIGTEAGETTDEDADDSIRTLGYKGGKRYTRLTLTPANNTGDLFLSAGVILGHPYIAPITQN